MRPAPSRSARSPAKVDDPLGKRLFDRIAAAVLLPALSPLLAALALAVRRASPGPALFRQERLGRGGKPFLLYKFRTLPVQAAAGAEKTWAAEAPRPAMRFLRRTGLDELPQLWNVLRGEMSLVGPRPERPYFARRFAARLPRYEERLRVRGGITGWAQIHGLRGDTSIARRLEYDLEYVERRSAALDLLILARTALGLARAVLAGPDATADPPLWRDRSTSWTM